MSKNGNPIKIQIVPVFTPKTNSQVGDLYHSILDTRVRSKKVVKVLKRTFLQTLKIHHYGEALENAAKCTFYFVNVC